MEEAHRMAQDLTPYAGEKGNLRFPYSEPIPYELIERITRLRVQQNLAKASAKVASNKEAKSHVQAK